MIKVRIDTNGWLYLNRAGKLEIAGCPFKTANAIPQNFPIVNNHYCGTWCAHFSEPCNLEKSNQMCIELCQNKMYYFNENEFEDLRKKEEGLESNSNKSSNFIGFLLV